MYLCVVFFYLFCQCTRRIDKDYVNLDLFSITHLKHHHQQCKYLRGTHYDVGELGGKKDGEEEIEMKREKLLESKNLHSSNMTIRE